MNAAIRKLLLNGVEIAVRDQGSGDPALVFLHYWGGSSRTWQEIIDRLAESNRCIAYDRRGWGESGDDPHTRQSLDLLARDCLALVQTLQLERYVLIGHSMGGKLVQLLASTNPMGLAGTVLVAPAPPNPQILPPAAHEIQKHAYDNAENVAGTIAFLTQRPLSETLRKRVLEDSLGGSITAKYGWPNEMQLEDIAGAAESIRVPTLVLAGRDDRERPLSKQTAEVVSQIPGAELVVIPDAGHLLPLEAPEEVAEAIRSFLGKLPQGQAKSATVHGGS